MNIYPAILTDSFEVAQSQLDMVQAHPEIEAVQVDIIDGFFADTLTVSPLDLATMDFGQLKCDLHLMVDEPLDFVFEATALKDQIPIQSIIAQVERMSWQSEYLQEVRRYGWKVGLSLDIYTPLEAIDEESWLLIDKIQIMGNKAGEQGHELHPLALEKVAELQAVLREYQIQPEVLFDIGVKPDLIPKLQDIGVQGVAMGSAIWQATDPHQVLSQLVREYP